MSYKEDFARADQWTVADVSTRLNTRAGQAFLAFLRAQGVDTVVRYYASSPRPKTITPGEAKALSGQGFAILPVFQDSGRDLSDFSDAIGAANARSAIAFARRVGQPADGRGTILFAVDADYRAAQIAGPIVAHFAAIKKTMAGRFRIGAYGSGAVLSALLDKGLIEIPWISMSRAFLGTEHFFYSNRWAMRQVPPEQVHGPSGIGYDRNVVRVPRDSLGAFRLGAAG